jgi:hypothetical protein
VEKSEVVKSVRWVLEVPGRCKSPLLVNSKAAYATSSSEVEADSSFVFDRCSLGAA